MTTDLPIAHEIPEFDSDEDAAEWFDTHDTSDLPGEPVELEPAIAPMVSYSIRFDRDTIEQLRAVAAARGLPATALMRDWVSERLAVERLDDEHARLREALHRHVDRALAEAR